MITWLIGTSGCEKVLSNVENNFLKVRMREFTLDVCTMRLRVHLEKPERRGIWDILKRA
jgi:hypothetical protein